MAKMTNNDDARFLDLLQKWQSGDFTRRDEQEMNALSAGDDFLRESWEGFLAEPETEHEVRLSALRARLRIQSGRGGARRVGILPWLAAAAAVLCLGGAVLFFQNGHQDAAAQIADQEAPTSAPLSPAPSTPGDPAENEGLANQKPLAAADQMPIKDRPLPTTSQLDRALGDPAAPALTQASAEAPVAVASESADALAERKASPAARSESEKDLVRSPAELSKEKMTAKPVSPARSRMTGDTAWNRNQPPPDMATRRKETHDAKQLAQSAPAGGWEEFEEYLRQNARLTPEARNHNVSGSVRLQFNINENGDPQGFIRIRSLGYGCDQEAIRLVQDWEWVRGRNTVVVVEVPFVR